MSREKKAQLNTRVSESLCLKVRNYANQEDISQGDVVQEALEKFLEWHKETKGVADESENDGT